MNVNIKNIVLKTPDFEDEKTIRLFDELGHIKNQGYLTKEQLIKILRWKSARPLRHYETNTEDDVIEVTRLAFSTPNDKLKIHILTSLTGVNYPSASAILMFYDRTIYPVLDIRVWQQLYNGNLVENNARGQNFTLNQVENYLLLIRKLSIELNLSARQVEKRLFDFDRETRKEKLCPSVVTIDSL
ncbi:MAG: hypothetical protein Q8904_00680 [Bacteroidota bacterium]|nr:hypothetical protein [Bacteroidota bacterium]